MLAFLGCKAYLGSIYSLQNLCSLTLLTFFSVFIMATFLYLHLKNLELARTLFLMYYIAYHSICAVWGTSLSPIQFPMTPQSITNPSYQLVCLPVNSSWYPHVPLTDLMNFPHQIALPPIFCIWADIRVHSSSQARTTGYLSASADPQLHLSLFTMKFHCLAHDRGSARPF